MSCPIHSDCRRKFYDCCVVDIEHPITSACYSCRNLMRHTVLTLSHNLAIAAGLCRAWMDGFHSAALLHSAAIFEYWRPGCGRAT